MSLFVKKNLVKLDFEWSDGLGHDPRCYLEVTLDCLSWLGDTRRQ